MRRPVAGVLSVACVAAATAATATPALHAREGVVSAGVATSAIRVDGVLDEPAWRDAGVIDDLVQQAPRPGEPTPFKTEVRVLADAKAIYLGFTCFDPDPGRIAVHTMQRDADLSGDDTVAFLLDPLGDGRNGYLFRVNAAGALFDGLVTGPEGASTNWDGLWEAKTRRTATGWTAEIRLPAATLRFRAGRSSWGFNAERYVARERLTSRFEGTTLDSKFPDVSRAGTLTGISRLDPGLGLELRPYALARREADFVERQAATTADVGFDASLNLASQLRGSITVNTDFAETDADARQVNLTRFPLFFPEKRAFFLEGSDLFEFGLGLGSDFVPFYSRRVGLFRGEAVPILAGVKVIGREGRFGLALVDVETARDGGAARTNSFAGRATFDVDQHLRVGLLATHGEPSGTKSNSLGGVDAVWRTSRFAGDKDFLVGAWGARSKGDVGPGSRVGWGLKIDYPNDLWDVSARFQELGDALDPGIGFLPRPGTRFYRVGVAYQPRPSRSGPFRFARQFFFELFPRLVTDLSGTTQSWSVFTAPVNVRLESGDRFELNWLPSFERLDAPFEVSAGILLPSGSYRFDRFRAEVRSSEHRPLRAGATVWFGSFYSGRLTESDVSLDWTSPRGHMSVRLEAIQAFGSLPAGRFVERVWQLRGVLAVSPDVILSTYLQYDSGSREVGANTRLRWTLRPGTELFLVWNRNAREPREDGGLRLKPVSEQIVLKVRATIRP